MVNESLPGDSRLAEGPARGQSGEMLSLIRRIHRAVVGSESWYAAWQAVKTVLKEHWPDALPSIGLMVSAVWTWLSGSAVPWAILAGIFAFVMFYIARVAYDFRHGHLPVHPVSSDAAASDLTVSDSTSTIPPAINEQLAKLAVAIGHSSEFAAEISRLSADTSIKEAQLIILRDVMPKLNHAADTADKINDMLSPLIDANIDALVLERVRIAIRAVSALDRHAEPTSAHDIQPFCDSVDEAIHAARRILDNTVVLADLRMRLHQSSNRADYMLEHKEVTCPDHISELQYRKFVIAKTQLEDAVAQLESTATEMEEKLRFHTDQLKELAATQ